MNPIRLLVASCVLAVAAPGAHAQPRYSLTPIPVGPFYTTGAFGLNDAGHVIGRGVPLGPTPASGFYWSPETGIS